MKRNGSGGSVSGAGSNPASGTGDAPRKCTVSSCDNDALPGSVYCSNQCILRHAKESLKAIAKVKLGSVKAVLTASVCVFRDAWLLYQKLALFAYMRDLLLLVLTPWFTC